MLIAKHTLARLIVTYYWAFILCSFVLFCVEVIFFQVDGGVIAFSYYAFYLVVGGLTKHLLLNKIPSTLLALRATGALKESAVERLTTSPVTRLEKPLGHSLGILLILFMSWFYGFECGRFPEWPSGVLCWRSVIIDLLLAYAGGIAIWIFGVTAWEFRYLGRIGELQIQPFHPDKCAGLGAIGQLFFFSSFILVVLVVFSADGFSMVYGIPNSTGHILILTRIPRMNPRF